MEGEKGGGWRKAKSRQTVGSVGLKASRGQAEEAIFGNNISFNNAAASVELT